MKLNLEISIGKNTSLTRRDFMAIRKKNSKKRANLKEQNKPKRRRRRKANRKNKCEICGE